MYKFNRQYEMILEDIIQSVTPKELKERKAEYSKIKIKMIEKRMVKNPDGSYDVEGNVNLCDLNLRSLKDIPYVLNKINGDFYCSHNKLTSLEGCPKIVNGDFSCSSNELTSLEGCPEKINGSFICSRNELTSLEGCPEKINKTFICSFNKLTSLEGCSKTVNGNFSCFNNLKIFSEEYVRKLCDVRGYVYV